VTRFTAGDIEERKRIGCGGCAFAQKVKSGIFGSGLECHRFPKSWAGAPAVAHFPNVNPDDWCGELIEK
jgi:hypothetical protein